MKWLERDSYEKTGYMPAPRVVKSDKEDRMPAMLPSLETVLNAEC